MEYLLHYGVKGMHWGEWNEETRERYGIRDDDGGLSKLKAFRETSYTLPAGAPLKRLSSKEEARRGTDLSRPFYASSNEYDYETYIHALDGLPGTSKRNVFGRLEKDVGLVSMSAVEDMTVARGRFVMDQLTGHKPSPEILSSPFESYTTEGWSSKNYRLDDERSDLHDLAKRKLKDPEVLDHFRKLGYDAIEDIEDQTHTTFHTSHPLIVLNGGKVGIDSTETFNRHRERQYPEW